MGPFPDSRTAVALTTMLLVAFSFGMAGRISAAWSPAGCPGPGALVDAGVGVLVAAAAALVTVWLLASTMVTSSSVSLDSAILQSRIINGLDRVLPAPPSVFSQAQGFLTAEGFPPMIAAWPRPRPGRCPCPRTRSCARRLWPPDRQP